MKAKEALVVFERAKETGFCVSLRGFAKCVGVVPSTIVNWKNDPEKELKGIETIKVQHVKEEVEKFEPEFVDWDAFRRETAKDILCAVLSTPKMWEETTYDGLAKACVKQVDELIKQLKEKKE